MTYVIAPVFPLSPPGSKNNLHSLSGFPLKRGILVLIPAARLESLIPG